MQQNLLLMWLGLVFWATGQIWLAQRTVYPLFAKVGENGYVGYHSFYTRSIRLTVILPGFATFLLPLAMVFCIPAVSTALHVANIVVGMIGLIVTVGLEIPRHNKLERIGKNDRIIAELIRYNWPRTASITAQAAIAILMFRDAQPVW